MNRRAHTAAIYIRCCTGATALPRLADGDMVILELVMAGKRHHILPRFLLRGFASRVNGDRVFAHVY
ncbi:MAG TPA: hypothetical protein VN843_19825, partial [Anaerolineales bacterium]|nr:hypothetical protein [Anaerolineales bacterium]